jgi:hypothetical protein
MRASHVTTHRRRVAVHFSFSPFCFSRRLYCYCYFSLRASCRCLSISAPPLSLLAVGSDLKGWSSLEQDKPAANQPSIWENMAAFAFISPPVFLD